MTRGRIIFGVVVVFVFSAASMSSMAEPVVSYAPSKVTLAGQIVIDCYFGPPSFGEHPKTDSKVSAPVLVLKGPISVKPPPGDKFSDPVSGVNRIQIIDPRPFKYQALCGRSVRIEGTLDEADTANLETKVVLNIDRIVWEADAGKCVTNDYTKKK